MAKEQKKTIIITTHYIEEASLADCVSKYTYINSSDRYLKTTRSMCCTNDYLCKTNFK